jgi:hypothetical protein
MTILFGLLFFIFNRVFEIRWIWNYIWIAIVAGCIVALLVALPRSMYSIKTLKALASLPRGMFLMLGSLFKIKGADKQFIHTQHSAKSNSKS